MASGGHSPVLIALRVRPEFASVIDELAKRRNLNRSAYIRELIREDALRLAAEVRSDAE